MGSRKITVKSGVAESIAAIAWYIESFGLVATGEKFSDEVYDHFLKMADMRKTYPVCREPTRKAARYKCVPYKKKYTIVFIESETELVICEFTSSKLIYW